MRGGRITYSAAEMAWLESNRDLVISDYHRAFVEAFARADVSAANLHALRKRKGWKVGRALGRTAGRHRSYSPQEIAWLKANSALPIGDYHAGFISEFGREVSAPNINGLRKRMGWRTGRTGHFPKGHVPDNKGKECPAGVGGRHPNAQRTQFKSGQAPHNTKFLGHERVSTAGYVEISIAETNPHTGYDRRYVLKHVYLWEQENGPVPAGFALKCLGDRLDTDPTNWTLIPRAILPRLNGGRHGRHVRFDGAPDELKPTLLAVAHLDHAARKRRKSA